jgi:hypothetical protein
MSISLTEVEDFVQNRNLSDALADKFSKIMSKSFWSETLPVRLIEFYIPHITEPIHAGRKYLQIWYNRSKALGRYFTMAT